MPFTITQSLEYYNSKVRDGSIDYLKSDDTEYTRKRGREWEISLDPDYPQDPSERDDAHRHFKTTPEQRAFIEAYTLPLTNSNEHTKAPSKQNLRTNKRVTFGPKVSVRSDADIDMLCKQALALSNTARKPSFRTRALSEGPGREQWLYRRETSYFERGQWSAPKGSVAVDTSGRIHLDAHDAWEDYVRTLEEECKEVAAAQSDLRAALEAFAGFVIVWVVLLVLCTIVGASRMEEIPSL
jgi:hypothetical protein